MATKRALPKKFEGVDLDALAVLVAEAIESRRRRGLPLTREQVRAWTPELDAEFRRRHLLRGHIVKGNLLDRASQPDARAALLALALRSIEDDADRVLGKPTERVQLGHKLTVVFSGGGIDPSRLPAAPTKPVMNVPPKPSLPVKPPQDNGDGTG